MLNLMVSHYCALAFQVIPIRIISRWTGHLLIREKNLYKNQANETNKKSTDFANTQGFME